MDKTTFLGQTYQSHFTDKEREAQRDHALFFKVTQVEAGNILDPH